MVANRGELFSVKMADSNVGQPLVTITSFKAKTVEMHGREHLEHFREAATAVGVGLGIPHWRTSISIESKVFKDLVDTGVISTSQVDKIHREIRKSTAVGVVENVTEHGPSRILFRERSSSTITTTTETTTTTTTTSESTTSTSTTTGVTTSSSTTSVDETPRRPVSSNAVPAARFSVYDDAHVERKEERELSDRTDQIPIEVMKALKLTKGEIKSLNLGGETRFVIASENFKVEPLSFFSKRSEMWSWFVCCLRKGGGKGPLSHLVDQVTKYDVSALFTAIVDSVDIQNPFVFWKDFENFVNAGPEKGEDIFTYFTRLRKLVENLAIRDPEEMGIHENIGLVSDLALRLKMIDSISRYPEYKSFASNLRTQKPAKWIRLTESHIISELRTIHDNNKSMAPRAANANQAIGENSRRSDSRGRSRGGQDGGSGRDRSRSAGPQGGCPRGTCRDFWETGKCNFETKDKKCSFVHTRKPAGGGGSAGNGRGQGGGSQAHGGTQSQGTQSSFPQRSKSKSPGRNPPAPQQQQQQKQGGARCTKCAGPHNYDKCTFTGACDFCHKEGHKEICCRIKKRSDKKEARFSEADPILIRSRDSDNSNLDS